MWNFDEIVQFKDPNVVEGIKNHYILGEMLGRGSFGVVKKATIKDSETEDDSVAVKIIQKSMKVNEETHKQIISEIQILHLVVDKFCVSIIDSRQTPDAIYIVMEYCIRDLFNAVCRDNISESNVKNAIKDLTHGLQYLHDIGICHRDIKPGNLLQHYDSNTWKIADFGISILFTPDNLLVSGNIGTPHYMAPEMFSQPQYTAAVDLWAAGVTCYFALSQKYPWDGTEDEVKEQVTAYQGNLVFDEEFSDLEAEAKDFLRKLLQPDPDRRLTAEEAIYHPWMQ